MIMCRATEETDEHEAKTRENFQGSSYAMCKRIFLYFMADDLYKRNLHMVSG